VQDNTLQINGDFGFSEFCGSYVPSDDANATDVIIEKCNFDTLFLQSSLEPFTIVTGGFLPVIFWACMALATYVKYKNAMLAMMMGIPVMMIATFAIPTYADIYVTVLGALAIAVTIFILIWKIPRD